MGGTHLEVERTYTLASAEQLPDLAALPQVVSVRRLDDEDLDATYYDTSDLRLARAGLTLRRREGGRDPGWTLKLPAAVGVRHEITEPAAPRSKAVPIALRHLVQAQVRGARLQPVVRIRTHRQVHQLVDADAQVLAECADDTVTAERLRPPSEPTAWRELELELVGGDQKWLDRADRALRDQGASVPETSSKLARALGAALPRASKVRVRKHTTAGEALLVHLRAQVEELVSRDPGVRLDLPDALHKARVATRRLRSALKTFRPLLETSVTDPLRTELAYVAGVLGEARDAEVLRERFRQNASSLPTELDVGSVGERLDAELIETHRVAHARVVAELDGPRYRQLLRALQRLVDEPPLTARAQRRARPEFRRLLRRVWRRLERAGNHADKAATPEQRDLALHEVRKAGKQMRYAAEAAADALGKQATSAAARVEKVQEALGEHQDSVVARARLMELGGAAHLAGENAYPFGLLHGLEAARGDHAQAEYAERWRRLTTGSATRWLRWRKDRPCQS